MLLRIGVNLGDIIHDGTRTYGDGINVAARLESIAEPGGICISATVREAIFGKLGLPLRDLGDKALKNIDRPVHIYQIQPPGARSRRDWLGVGLRQYRRLAPALGLVILLAALAGVGAWRFWPRETLMPDYTPVIAVMPFAGTDGDAGLDRLGTSFAREVASVLSTFPLLRIVSASDVPPQKLASPKQAAQAVGANYALGGDISKTGGKTRIRAQLTDAASGETVWSDSYEFSGDDEVAIEEKTAEKIYSAIGSIGGKVRKIEEAAAWRKPESALTDYDYYLRSMTYFMRYTPEDNLRSRKIAEEGLTRFPNSPMVKIRLAWTYLAEAETFGPFEDCRKWIEHAYALGREAEDAKNKSRFLIYQSMKLMSHVNVWREDFDRSVQQAEAAVEMSPFDAELRATEALVLASAGKLDKAIEWASWAFAREPQRYFTADTLAWAYYLAGRSDDAVKVIKARESSESWPALAIYAHAGRLDEAKATTALYLKSGPHSVQGEACQPIRGPMKQTYLDDLRKAGEPERASP
jgi:adenylate cyclase